MNEIHTIIPIELNEIFESLEYEEGDLIINGITFSGNNAELNLFLKLDYGNDVVFQNWKMITENCVDLKIDFDEIGQYFKFYDQHFLLSSFDDVSSELYIKNEAKNNEKLFAELCNLHYEIFENLFNLDKFIVETNLLERCKINNGIFARGPKAILDYYFKILEKFGTQPYYFENSRNLEKQETFKKFKLCVLGKNYFIGTDFKFQRID